MQKSRNTEARPFCHAEMRKCGNAEMPKSRNAKLQKCRNAEMPKCKIAEMRKCRNTEMPKCRNVKMQKCLNAEMQNCRNAKGYPPRTLQLGTTPENVKEEARRAVGLLSMWVLYDGSYSNDVSAQNQPPN